MNEHTSDGHDRRRRSRFRPAGLPAAEAGAALLAAGCGNGGSSPAAPGSTAFQQALAYAQCVRSHGAPSWPDPDSRGNFISTKANRGDFRAPASANTACAHLLPNNGRLTAAQQQRIMSTGLKYAACTRSHGITNFPDPGQRGGFNLGVITGLGIDVHAPQFRSAQQTCMPILNGGS